MALKCFILIFMCLRTNCIQIVDVELSSTRIPCLITEFFGNTSSLNIMFGNMDDIVYLKDLEIPYRILKREQDQIYNFVYHNFVIHSKRGNLKNDMYPMRAGQINGKIFIIIDVIDSDMDTLLDFTLDFGMAQIMLLVDGVNPMLYTYQPIVRYGSLSNSHSTISKTYCGIKPKPMGYFRNCGIDIVNPYSQHSTKNQDQFILNKGILNMLASTLNISINEINQEHKTRSCDTRIIQLGFLPVGIVTDGITGIEHDEMVWVVPKGEELTTFQVIAITFDKTMWILILTAFIVTFVSWCFLLFLTKGDNFMQKCIDCFFILIELTLLISLPRLPRRNIFRIILVAYTFYSLHICSLFGANLVTILTVPKFEKGISTLKELLDTNMTISVLQDMPSYMLFSSPRNNIQKQLENKITKFNDTIKNVLQKIVEHRNFSLLIRKKFLPKEYAVNVIIDRNNTNPVNIGLYFLRGHFLINVFNEIVQRLHESGLTTKITNNIPNDVRVIEDNSDIKLALDHLLFAYLLLVGGLLFASASFFIENIWRRRFN